MTYRNLWHCSALTQITFILESWLRSQSTLRAYVMSGDIGFRIRRNPDSFVGIDAAIVLVDTPLYRQGRKAIFDAPPLLAVEITSPSDRQDDIDKKVDEYLAAKVPLVWIVNPHRLTVTVYRPDAEPVLYAQSAEMTGEPHLPGLKIKVADLFVDLPQLP